MSSNCLSINSSKNQLIWFVAPQQLWKLDIMILEVNFPQFTFSASVRHHISVTFLASQSISPTLHAPTSNSGTSGPFAYTLTSIIPASVCFSIDYCNSPHIGLPKICLTPRVCPLSFCQIDCLSSKILPHL